MKFILFLLFTLPLCLSAQQKDESKYLEGAVPVVNGKVVFSRTFDIPSLSREEIFDQVNHWAESYFSSDPETKKTGKVIYTNREKGDIACVCEEYLIFTSTALSLDRSRINYQFRVKCSTGKCEVSMTSIRYFYENQHYPAEEMITDEHTLYKKKNKLIRQTGKFRIHTIDLAEELFSGVLSALVPPPSSLQPPAKFRENPVVHIAATPPAATLPASATSSLAGYKQIAPEQIPGNIIKMLSQDWMLITAGNREQFNTMTASWGGLGHLYNKPVAICFINPARYTYRFMEKEDSYTLTFYTEAYRDALKYCGSHSGKDTDKVKEAGLTPFFTPDNTPALEEAWMIIECRKLVSQSFIPEALADPKLREEWNGKPMHKMYIGEIKNVWVK